MKKIICLLTTVLFFAIYFPVNARELSVITPAVEFTEEDLRIMELHNIKANEYVQKKNSMMRGGAQGYIPVELVIQDFKNYCGPASTQMVLNYKNVFAETQLTLGKSWKIENTNLGVAGSKIVQVLNKYLGEKKYSINDSKPLFYNSIMYSIDNNYPVIYSTNIQDLFFNEQYPTPSGHYIVGNGYYQYSTGGTGYDYLTYIEPFDLWNYIDYGAGEYTVPSHKIFTAIENNPNGASYIIRYGN